MPPPASTVVARIWFNPNLDAAWSTVPSLVVVLTALGGLMVTALSVARERELGTFEQLLVSPLSPGEIVIGKSVPAFFIGMVEGTVMVVAAVFIFHVPLSGSLVLLYAGMAAFLSGRHRSRPVRLVAGENPATGHPGGVLVHGADDAAVGFRQPDRKHARLAASC